MSLEARVINMHTQGATNSTVGTDTHSNDITSDHNMQGGSKSRISKSETLPKIGADRY
jgi:hypothetical protein